MSARKAMLRGNEILCTFPYSEDMLARVRKVEERKFVKPVWHLKPSLRAIEFLVDNNFEISQPDLNRLSQMADKFIRQETSRAYKIKLAKCINAAPIPEVAAKMKMEAYSYQWAPAQYSRLCAARFLLADEMGVGKSIQSLMVTNLPEYVDKPVLIVTPVPYTFQAELLKFFGEHSVILQGPIHYLNPRVRYYIITDYQFKNLFDDVKKRIPKSFVRHFFLIVDEAHRYKNKGAQRTRLLRALSWICEHVILMTGTPVMNRPDELYELLVALDPKFMSWMSFMKRFCGLTWGVHGADHSGAQNLQYLNSWLYENIMVRREKKQVLSQLPPKVRETIPLKADPLDIHADSMFEMFSKSADTKSKDADFLEWLEDTIEQSGKLGIFAYHQVMLNAIEDLCKKKGYSFVRIDGTVDPTLRHEQLMRFQNDPTCKVAILSIVVAGTGLNGLQIAQTCIFAEFFWTPGSIMQAEDRFHRPGQKASSVSIKFPVITKFDDALLKLLLEKLGIIMRITGVDQIPDSITNANLMSELAKQFGIPVRKKDAVKPGIPLT